MKRLSIIIVTYNSEADIFDCVGSIKQYADIPKDDIELIIVDNCSREPQPMFDRLRKLWGEDIICIENERNGGYGQGNNVGLRASKAPYALIMNPDVRLYEPIFKKALATFDDKPEKGMLGMVQMYSPTERSRHSFCPTWLMNGYLHLALYAVCNRKDWYIPCCMYIQGSCFFLRKDMFERAGMYDETNFMYCEEEDVHYRMKRMFGSRCFAFDRSLHYIHLAEGREPSFDYERRLVDTDVKLYEKKGVSRRLIIRHYLQNNKVLLWRASRSSTESAEYKVLHQLVDYLKKELHS